MDRFLDVCGSGLASRRHVVVFQAVLIIAAVAFAFFSPDTTYDYLHYGGQWRHILEGGNPWEYARGDTRRFNAYGPLHSLMAYPYAWSSNLPKAIYALASVSATVGLMSLALDRRDLPDRARTALVLFLIFNPPLWIQYVYGGFNDALVGALFLLGIVAYDCKRFRLSAFSLGLGILYKFTPVFAIPFLCIRHRRVNWTFAIPLVAMLAVGFGLAYWAWGASILDPVLLGAGRRSSSASIFNFLQGKYSPIPLLADINIDFLSMPLLGLALAAIFLAYLVFDLPVRAAVVLAFSSVLLLYRVNHLQFYFSLTLLLVYLVIEEYPRIKALSPRLVGSIGRFLLWLCVVVAVWLVPSRAWKQEVHAVIGLPTFIVHTWMNVHLIAYLVRSRRTSAGGSG